MKDEYLKIIEVLGEAIIKKDLDIDLLKFENERLKETIKSIENFANNCEKMSN